MDESQSNPQQQAWRDNSAKKTSCAQWTPVEAMAHRLADKMQANKLPARQTLKLKMAVHKDLMRHFAVMAAKKKDGGGAQEHIKDRFHFVRKPHTKPQSCCTKNLQNAALLMKQEEDNKISDLVTKVESTKFKITADPKTDFSIARGVSTMSCYDNIPREPVVDIGDGNSLESRPDVTQKLENIVSLDIGANAQNQAGSQLAVIEPQSLIDFSRRFREYCTNMINPQLNEALERFLQELLRLQKNLYNRDNVKGRFRRRFYAGFKDIERRLQLNKIKFVIVAPDLDKNKDKGELDKLVHRFIDSCGRHEIPVIFGLSRRKLGYITHGKGFVSCIGVANYEALEDKLEDALKKVLEARNEFKILNGEEEKTIDMTKMLTEDLLLSERVKVLLKTLSSL